MNNARIKSFFIYLIVFMSITTFYQVLYLKQDVGLSGFMLDFILAVVFAFIIPISSK